MRRLRWKFSPVKRGLALRQSSSESCSGERMHRVGAADRGGAGLRQADVADFARCDEISGRADGVLDGRVRVDAVLVAQVDVISA